MKIAVTGATGQLGQLVIEQLLSRTHQDNIVALVRDPQKAQTFEQQGIETRAFDYTNPIDQLSETLKGITHLLLISSSEVGQRIPQHKNVIDAAKNANVSQIAYTSILNAEQSPLALAQEHVATEHLIKTSGLIYTLLRNSWYSENYAISLPQAVEYGTIFGATHHGKISSASRLDYATAAAVILTETGHGNKTYELAGDQSYTLDDVAKWASEVSGKLVKYEDLSEQEFKNTLIKAGLPEALATMLADSDESVSQNGLFSESKDLQHLINRPTTPMHKTVQQFLS
ncbi:SDR family oxidoreductase [Acinetobacter qingfengensis]|uniref:NAD(P)-dependent oxidoreductase n=1 Tax=Acinetobacter qingfengensis TaxID=1262585 RepID=A0A1E7REL9_9GAMM|nr:SDR family oxidoreductase [Acinetobacter qingfengensis]KAA8734782.1 SDR family oxidoreductase [Acinetobacter qingfengensis]OEY97702.1 NAD(P)-dependent oxidoreductase [Acinetobacter qingfengensis]